MSRVSVRSTGRVGVCVSPPCHVLGPVLDHNVFDQIGNETLLGGTGRESSFSASLESRPKHDDSDKSEVRD